MSLLAGAATATQLNTVNAATTSTVTATAVSGISGTATAIAQVIAAKGATGNKINLDNDFTINVDSGTLTVSQANDFVAAGGVLTEQFPMEILPILMIYQLQVQTS